MCAHSLRQRTSAPAQQSSCRNASVRLIGRFLAGRNRCAESRNHTRIERAPRARIVRPRRTHARGGARGRHVGARAHLQPARPRTHRPGLRADLVLVAGDPTHDIRPPAISCDLEARRSRRTAEGRDDEVRLGLCECLYRRDGSPQSPHLFDRIAVLPRWSLVENQRVLCILKRGQKRV